MNNRTKNNRNSGFTLVETLVTVAIVVILLGVSAVMVVRYIDRLKLTELDNAAREIYMAAENRAVLLSGNQQLTDMVYTETVITDDEGNQTTQEGPGVPVKLGFPHDDSDASKEDLYYVHVDDARNGLLDIGNIDPTLLENDFYIVYDLASGSVTDVVYAEKKKGEEESLPIKTLVENGTDDSSDSDITGAGSSPIARFKYFYGNWWTQDHSTRVSWKRKGFPLVGWYYGEASEGSAQPVSPDGQPVIRVEIKNKEELTVTVSVFYGEANGVSDPEVQEAVKKALGFYNPGDSKLSVKLGPDDESDKGIELTRESKRLRATPGDTGFKGNSYSRTWVLDTLEDKPDWKFKAFNTSETGVNPGQNFKITASIPKDDILDISTRTQRNNSLFAYVEGKSGNDTAYIGYLRHLQNLDKDGAYKSGVINNITKAVQIKDVWGEGNNDDDGSHKAFFEKGYNFIPIVNDNLTSYDGSSDDRSSDDGSADEDSDDEESGTTGNGGGNKPVYKIRNLKVETAQTAAGLFSRTPTQGMTFQNIRLVNTTVQATAPNATVGALVGQTSGTTKMDNCWVYWEDGDGIVLEEELGTSESGDPEDYTYQLTGSTVGGLVGITNGKVEIIGSLASTMIKGTSYAGGLVGQMKAADNTITNSYADCYLTGGKDAKVAGLVGNVQVNNGVTLKKCYSAGFILGVEQPNGFTAAGLCLSDRDDLTITVNNVYSVVMYPDFESGKSIRNWDGRIYGLTNMDYSSTASGHYTYLGGTDGSGSTSANMTEENFDDTMNAGGSEEDGKFVWKTAGQSNPYDLRENLTLGIYSYPGLDGLDHYGDWGAEFKDPSLVYYEKYDTESTADPTDVWGISGGNARNLLNVNNLQDVRTVLSDGYAVAFLVGDADDSVNSVKIKYSYTYLEGNNPKIAKIDGSETTETIVTIDVLKAGQQTAWEGDGGVSFNAYVIPLPDELVYSDFALDCFYRYVKFELYFVDSAGEEKLHHTGEYIFNPHFAEALEMYDDGSDDNTLGTKLPDRDWTKDNIEDQADGKANTMGSVKIRTPRHLFDLSEFPEYYRSSKRYTFSQALDLNYFTYDWRGVTDDTKTVFERTATGNNNIVDNITLNNGKLTAPYAQNPIGRNEREPFTGAYEGGYNYVKNVLPNVKLLDEQNRYMGLFGYSTVRLRNIFYQMGPDEGGDESLYQMTTQPLSEITNNLYIGGLAGGSTGTITNCAVYGVDLKTDISSAKMYIGGLVGLNNGSISDCSVESNKLVANAYNYAGLYMGGFVGENGSNRTINSSYAVGRINVEVNNTQAAQICGFAGKNSGTITDAYAATDLEYSGLGVDRYPFCNERDSGSQLRGYIGYLDQGSYTYRGISYAANYKPKEGEPEGYAKSYTYEELSKNGNGVFDKFPTMGKAKSAPQLDIEYPFPAVVQDAKGDYIHHGEVQKPIDLLDMGVLYWEVLEIDGKETYHISALAVNNTNGIQSINEISTLSNAHDDGGVVTKYGYGYYYREGDKPTFTPGNIGYFEYTKDTLTTANKLQISRTESIVDLQDSNSNYDGAVHQGKKTVESNGKLEEMLSGYRVISWDSYREGGRASTWGYDKAERYTSATDGLVPIYLKKTSDGNRQNGYLHTYTNQWDPKDDPAKFILSKGTGNNKVTVEFVIDPHFAAAMSVGSVKKGTNTNAIDEKSAWVQGDDDTKKKLTTLPGQADNPFQVRCGTQLQEINASTRIYTDIIIGAGGGTSAEEGKYWNLPTAQYFPYLSSLKIGETDSVVTTSSSRGYNDYFRYYYFEQTHDMDWTAEGNTYGNGEPGVFTPIAATAARPGDSRISHIQLPGWFAGSYNGQNYTLKNFNIDINTGNFNTSCMGLFGAINSNAGNSNKTKLENIVMYSETGTDTVTVRGRSTGISSDDKIIGGGAWCSDLRWYAGGALVGVALGKSEITNCAVAGYTIVDETTTAGDNLGDRQYYSYNVTTYGPDAQSYTRSRQSNVEGSDGGLLSNAYGTIRLTNDPEVLGGAIGGLVGITDGPLEGCVAVTKILLKPNHADMTLENFTGTKNSTYWYDYKYFTSGGTNSPVCVGGLVGTTTAKVENCYTGGTITVTDDAKNAVLRIGRVIGGMGAGVFAKKTNVPNVSILNCYSYMELPSTNGYNGRNLTVATYNIGGKGACTQNNRNVSDLDKDYYLENVGAKANDGGTSVTYQQLSGKASINNNNQYILALLGDRYAWVTKTTSDGLSVPGRFSYVPQNRDDLRGLDFPFPTVLKMDGYNVHYGGWALSGIERFGYNEERGAYDVPLGGQPAEVDVFSDEGLYQELLKLSTGVTRGGEWKVKFEKKEEEEEQVITAGFSKDQDLDEAEIIDDVVTDDGKTITCYSYTFQDTDGQTPLRITALKPTVTPEKVYIEYKDTNGVLYTLTITVNVTAKVKLMPEELTMYPGEVVYVKIMPVDIPDGTYTLTLSDGESTSDLLGGFAVEDNPQIIRLATGDFGEENEDRVWIDIPYTYSLSDEDGAYYIEDIHRIYVNLKSLPQAGIWDKGDGDVENNISELWKWTIDLQDYIEFDEENIKVVDINGTDADVTKEVVTVDGKTGKVITLTKGENFPTDGATLTITTEVESINGIAAYSDVIGVTVDDAEASGDVTEEPTDDTEASGDVTEEPTDDAEASGDVTGEIVDDAEVSGDGTGETVDGAEASGDGTGETVDDAEVSGDGTEETVDDAEVSGDGTEEIVDDIEATSDGIALFSNIDALDDGILKRVLTIEVPAPIELKPVVKWDSSGDEDEPDSDSLIIDFSEYGLDTLEVEVADENSSIVAELLEDGNVKIYGFTEEMASFTLNVTLTKGKLLEKCQVSIFWTDVIVETIMNEEDEYDQWNISFGDDVAVADESEVAVLTEGFTAQVAVADEFEIAVLSEDSAEQVTGDDSSFNSVVLTRAANEAGDEVVYPLKTVLKVTLTRDGLTQNCELTVYLPEPESVSDESDESDGDGIFMEPNQDEIDDGTDSNGVEQSGDNDDQGDEDDADANDEDETGDDADNPDVDDDETGGNSDNPDADDDGTGGNGEDQSGDDDDPNQGSQGSGDNNGTSGSGEDALPNDPNLSSDGYVTDDNADDDDEKTVNDTAGKSSVESKAPGSNNGEDPAGED